MNTNTLEQLEEMSDFELNEIAFSLKVIPVSILTFEQRNGFCFNNSTARYHAYKSDEYMGHIDVDYCNKWSDCGELIDELNLSIVYLYNGEYEATNGCMLHYGSFVENRFYCMNKNPKRAATIVYILIKQEENK